MNIVIFGTHNVRSLYRAGLLITIIREMDLRETGSSGTDWIHLAQHRGQWKAFLTTVMNLRVPKNICKFFSCCATSRFSRTQLHLVS
jgi:hypothetical protein